MLHGLFALLREGLYMTIIGKQIRIERILNRNTGRTVIGNNPRDLLPGMAIDKTIFHDWPTG